MKNTIRVIAASLFAATTVMAPINANADAVLDAAKNALRSDDAKARDEYRHPQQTLRFFGIKPDMTVVEIWPGGGWYTDILFPLLAKEGNYIAAHFYIDDESGDYYKRSLASFQQKTQDGSPYEGVTITAFHPQKALAIAPEGSADAVLTFRNIHNWYMGGERDAVVSAFSSFYKALKPGGILGVVEHQLPETAADENMKSSGYMKKSFVIDAAKAAGFELAAESAVNANPLDTADHPRGVWTLPPSLRLGQKDQEKYMAIGESNRMTLKFVKPE
ncbi:methyltransferase [Alteromonas sp. 14N.309.X.WAT.G.H12]|uniref:class I SAM-dependent methyltransferase n=1 Tax=Alteromonas sp. 14N.309.X.WAT.G.H12 TaxID=3120824 RepID=UPI002FD665E9